MAGVKFLADLITKDALQFQTSGGSNAGKIEMDGDNLVLSNAVGDILFGDTDSNIYIGDGINSVDILFEQSGSIRSETGSNATLTLGSSGTTLNLYNPQVGNGMTLTSTMTIGTGGSIDFTPDTGVLLKFDGQTILERKTANGAITLGHDDSIIIAGGDMSNSMNTNINNAEETVFIGAEGGVMLYGFPNNDAGGWSARSQFLFSNDGKMYFGTASDTNLYRSAANTLKTDDNFIVGGGNLHIGNAIYHDGDTDTYIWFTDNRIRIDVGGVNKFDSNNTYLTSINNGNWSGTDLSIANGGTGASTASAARTNLGLGSAATSNTSAFDAAGSAATALSDAQTWVGEQNYASDSAISTAVASYLPLAGGTMTNTLTINTTAVPFNLIENGHTGTGKYWRIPLDGGNIRFDVDTTNTNGNGTFASYTDVLLLKANGGVQLSNYGAGILKTDASGNISLDTSTYLTSINNGNWSGTDLSVANGGTGSSTASGARTNLGLGSLATLSTVNASTITDNSVGAAELNVSGNGTSGYFLRSDGDGSFTWAVPTTSTVDWTEIAGDQANINISGFNNDSGFTDNAGTITGVSTGTGLDGTATSGSVTISLDLSELADMTQTMIGTDEFIVLDNGAERRKAANEIGLSIFSNDSSFITGVDWTEIAGDPANVNISGFNNDAGYVTSSGNTVIGTDSDLNTSGSTIIDNIYVTDGVITSMGTRTLGAGDIGAAYYDHIRSLGSQAFTNGSDPNITTAQVISEIESDGGFDSFSSVFKTSWSYAGNYNLTDAGNFTETAGSSWITWTDNSSDSTRGNITALAIAPNTGGSAGGVFIYNDQGGGYSPGWREVWTSSNFADNSSNWNTAYGWGDHGAEGYLTAHPNISAESSVNNSGRTYIQDITLDSNGHITAITSATETVTNTNTQLSNTEVIGMFTAGTNVTISAEGVIAATDTDTVYTHPTSAGNKHVPTGGAAGQFLKYSSSGTATWATPSYTTNTNTTYSAGSGLDLTSTTFSVEPDLRDGITHVGKDANNYIQFDSTNGRIDFYAGGVFVARMESDGDLHMKGDVIAYSDIF